MTTLRRLCTTQVEIHPLILKWEIKQYSAYKKGFRPDGSQLTTNGIPPLFSSAYESGHAGQKWKLQLNHQEEVDYISVYLHLVRDEETTDEKPFVSATFRLYNGSGVKYPSSLTFTKHYEDIQEWGFPKFMKVSDLTGEVGKHHGLLDDDSLRIYCKLRVYGSLNSSNSTTNGKVDVSNKKMIRNRMLSDFTNIYERGSEFTDVTIVTANGNTMQFHKVILAARSPVFRAMLSAAMIESQQCKIEILDFDESVVIGMLEYIYTGSTICLREDGANNIQYLAIADKYDIPELKKEAENNLMKEITIANAAELVAIAYLHNVQGLKTELAKYFIAHKNEIISTEGFIRLNKSNPVAVADFLMTCLS